MKRILSLLVAVCFLSLCTGCNGGGGGDSGGGAAASDTSIVTLDFDIGDALSKNDVKGENLLAKIIDFITMARICHAAPLYNYITTLHLEITGTGFTPIIRDIPITTPSSTFSVSQPVQNGSGRRFYIELRDSDGNALYAGVLTIDVGNAGASQDITVDVSIDEGLNLEDFINMGRDHLERQELEQAYDDFETVLNIQSDHPVANFFCALTHLLLLIQKDDPAVNAAAPNADITSMLNFYTTIDVYSDIMVYNDPNDPSGGPYYYDIAPDIYDDDEKPEEGPEVNEPGLQDEGYDDKVKDFYDNEWVEPAVGVSDTERTIDVLKNVLLPEIDNIIDNLQKVQEDSEFATTLTTDMHFGISSLIKADRADAYILQAIAYGLKAYLNHWLAYEWRTDANYWYDESDNDSKYPLDPINKTPPYYAGLQSIIENDPGLPGSQLLDPADGSADYLSTAQKAYLKGLTKFKAGLNAINDGRTTAEKNLEDHLFNIANFDDPVEEGVDTINISKIITNIDEAIAALNGEATITDYDEYDDASTEFETTGVDLSSFFSSPNRDTMPKFYYHATSDSDMPVFDTNMSPTDPESSKPFIDELKRFVKSIDGNPIDGLQDALVQDILPGGYKLYVPDATAAVKAMGGYLSDWTGINPVIFDDEDDEPANRDVVKAYLAKGDDGVPATTYLYIGMQLRGAPFSSALQTGDNFNYQLRFKASGEADGYHDVPVIIELRGNYSPVGNVWSWHLISYGIYQGPIPIEDLDASDFTIGSDLVVFRLPIDDLVDAIDEFEPDEYFPGGVWDGKEIFVDMGVWSDIVSEGQQYWNYTSGSQLVNLE